MFGLPEASQADLERFFDKVYVDDTTGCWIWTGCIQPNGYGQFWYCGRVMGAHRWAYQIFKGEVKGTQDVHHTCGMRCCVNPKHLELIDRVYHGYYHMT